jgi:PAP_fibrillin
MTTLRVSAAPLVVLLALCFTTWITLVASFQQHSLFRTRIRSLRFSAPSDVENEEFEPFASNLKTASAGPMILECTVSDENEALKRELLKLAASFDRGFGASRSAREKADALIQGLERGNTAFSTAAATILSNSRTSPTLAGNWRMIWTTALDVLSLQASPLFMAGAIYQVFDADTRIVTNIIDFIPRAQSLLPVGIIPNSLIRAKVQTKACQPAGTLVNEYPSRVGLIFESVSVKPIQLFGMDSSMLPPLQLDLPKLPGTGSTEESPGYFDVTYLDNELLIIRQNAPGGIFVLIRVDSIDA